MAIQDDFSIGANGDIRHVSGTTRYPSLAFYRYLQSHADDGASSGDDVMDIIIANPGSRQTDQAFTLIAPFNIDDATAQFLFGGSITQANGDTLYSAIDLQFLVQPFTANVYMDQNGSRVDLPIPGGNSIADSEGFLVKVKTAGALIDNGDLRFYTRDLGNSYSDLAVNVASGGSTTVFLGPGGDANVAAGDGAIYAAVLADLTITFGTFNYDANNGNGSQSYDVQVAVSNGRSPLEVDQALQYLTRDGSAVDVGDGTEGQFYRLANAAYTPLPATPFASYAGGNITGAQGVYFTGFDAQFAQNFIGRDATGSAQTPPNFAPVSVTSLTIGDRAGIYRRTGSGAAAAIVTNEFTMAAGNTSGNGTLAVNETIDNSHPASGIVRAWNGTSFDALAYASFTGSTFTLSGTLPATYTSGDDAFVPFIDEVASGAIAQTTIIQSTAIDVLVRVRNADPGNEIIPFQVDGQIGVNGYTTSAIRTPDA